MGKYNGLIFPEYDPYSVLTRSGLQEFITTLGQGELGRRQPEAGQILGSSLQLIT